MATRSNTSAEQDSSNSLILNVDRYERLECIGRGSFGDVYRGYGRLAFFHCLGACLTPLYADLRYMPI